jgi:hypothetical protein
MRFRDAQTCVARVSKDRAATDLGSTRDRHQYAQHSLREATAGWLANVKSASLADSVPIDARGHHHGSLNLQSQSDCETLPECLKDGRSLPPCPLRSSHRRDAGR